MSNQIDARNPQLIGLEGWRVEVTCNPGRMTDGGEKRRFIVGRNQKAAPMQIHLELKLRTSRYGDQADDHYQRVTPLYRVR